MECYSCWDIAQGTFAINNSITDENCISTCCRFYFGKLPSSSLENTPEKTLESFLGMRQMAIIRGLSARRDTEDFVCAKCNHYVKSNWNFSNQIRVVNFSVYPSPCQCRCFYCEANSQDKSQGKNSAAVVAAYEKLFDALTLAKKKNIIAPKVTQWIVSSGELTIHPYKKQFMALTCGDTPIFYSNLFIFDEDIARELHDNPRAKINFSIDAGTAETWHKVKGVNNFNRVLDNLNAYLQAAQNADQVILKYIIFPGINDSDEDFLSLTEIVKALKIKCLIFSRDMMIYSRSKAALDALSVDGVFDLKIIESAARFLAVCTLCGVPVETLSEYTGQERQAVLALAQEIVNCAT